MPTKEKATATEVNQDQDTEKQNPADGTVAAVSEVLIVGACPIKIGEKYYVKDTVLSLDDDELKSQAWKHLFVSGNVVFKDDQKRTREYIESVKVKPVAQPVEPDAEK